MTNLSTDAPLGRALPSGQVVQPRRDSWGKWSINFGNFGTIPEPIFRIAEFLPKTILEISPEKIINLLQTLTKLTH